MLFEHAYAEIGDVRLHYVTAGQGPAVVLLHGWPQTWYMWRDVMSGLASRYRVIAPDLRGLGDSSRPANGYDKKTLAQDVWHLVHDVLREESLFVVGHDWGGPTAFALAAQHRELFVASPFSTCRSPETERRSSSTTVGITVFTGSPTSPKNLPPGARTSISASSTGTGAPGRIPFRKKLSRNTCAHIVSRARCALASTSIERYGRTCWTMRRSLQPES